MDLNTHPLYPTRYNTEAEDYEEKCPFYEHPSLDENNETWADNKNITFEELSTRCIWEWNSGKPMLVNLKEGNIKFKDGKPETPFKTGIKGRGLLGKYGPNHAADPIITRWIDNKLHFVAVKRKDTGEWAIPGGMVDPGEDGINTLRREFKEEACENCDDSILDMVFAIENQDIIYAGPIYRDPRTTDSAWIETLVVHYHIDNDLANKIILTPQKSEVKDVKWISCDEKLYGGHKQFIDMVNEKMEKLYKEKENENEDINYLNFYKVAMIMCYMLISITLFYFVLKIRNQIIKNEKNNIYFYEFHENYYYLNPMDISKYNNCYELFIMQN